MDGKYIYTGERWTRTDKELEYFKMNRNYNVNISYLLFIVKCKMANLMIRRFETWNWILRETSSPEMLKLNGVIKYAETCRRYKFIPCNINPFHPFFPILWNIIPFSRFISDNSEMFSWCSRNTHFCKEPPLKINS